jgi:hypothetical protein
MLNKKLGEPMFAQTSIIFIQHKAPSILQNMEQPPILFTWWEALLVLFLLILLVWILLIVQSRMKPEYEFHSEHKHEEEPHHTSDDLTQIEGIGPKIASLLNKAGITTFQQLAQADTDQLKKLLKEAKLPFTDPTTWSEQARLAAAGDYEGLKTMIEKLRGGRKT